MAEKLGMGVVVWSPLAGGLLTGKYNEGVPDNSRANTTNWLDGKLTEDDNRALHEEIQEILKTYESKVDGVLEKKTAEVLEV